MFTKYKKNAVYILCFLASLYIISLIIRPFWNIFNVIYEILLPFILGFGIAFVLHPLVDWLERRKIPRLCAVLIVSLGLLIILVVAVISVFPIFLREIEELSANSAMIFQNIDDLFKSFANWFSFLPEDKRPTITNLLAIFDRNPEIINDMLVNFALSFYSSLSLMLFVPMIAIYTLYDFNKIKCNFSNYLKKRKRTVWHAYFCDIKRLLENYSKGLFLVMLVMIILSTIGFYFIGLEYPLLFGIIIGLSNLVPIVGQLIGGTLVVIFALTQSVTIAIGALIIILILQLIESNLITPYIQSKTAKLSPVFVILSFIVFGRFFGIIGMIMAVPLLGVIILSINYLREYSARSKNIGKIEAQLPEENSIDE